MEYILKKRVNLLNLKTTVKLYFNLKINKSRNGFIDFDLNNCEIIINNLLKKIKQENIQEPINLYISNYLFLNIANLEMIEYENSKFISKITREDLE